MRSRLAVQGFAKLRSDLRQPLLVALTGLIACALFVVAPLHASNLIHSQALGAVLILVMLLAAFAVSDRPIPAFLVATAVALAGIAAVLRLSGVSKSHVYLDAASWLLLGIGLIWVVARAVFAPGRISYHRVVGAILRYLMIGMTFVALYAFAGLLLENAFTGLHAISDRQGLLSDLIYFSFVTLTFGRLWRHPPGAPTRARCCQPRGHHRPALSGNVAGTARQSGDRAQRQAVSSLCGAGLKPAGRLFEDLRQQKP